MSLLLYTTYGCYPCDRAKKTLINAKLPFKTTQAGPQGDILSYPTLCILDADSREVERLIGTQEITVDNIRKLANKHNIIID